MNDDFFIGYLPKAPVATARFTRRVVAALAAGAVAAGVMAALVLPHLGEGLFQFGSPRDFSGVLRCEASHAPRLVGADGDYWLVGAGKHGAPEICGADGRAVAVTGTLIERDGHRAIEVAGPARETAAGDANAETVEFLGNFTLTGEIVDPKCYLGVMNPGEGRVHRACATLCLRGGITPAFVARDRTGATVSLVIAGPRGEAIAEVLSPWVGEGVEASGVVKRRGRSLFFLLDPASLRLAPR